MYTALLASHNLVRWVVLALGAWTVFRAWRGWRARAVWGPQDAATVRRFVLAITVQFVLGVALYAVSPLVRQGLGDMATAMRTAGVRYFVVEHVVVMLAAVAFAHVGAARVRRAPTDSARFQGATIWMGLAFAAAAGFVPWFRPLFPAF